MLHKENLEKCEETKRRIEEIIRIYNLEEINFHYVTLFAYQMAEIYCYHGEKTKAMEQFKKYVELISRFLWGEINYLQSDNYLDRLNVWFKKSLLDGNFPREKRTVYDTLLLAFEAPEFEILKEEEVYMDLLKSVKEMQVN